MGRAYAIVDAYNHLGKKRKGLRADRFFVQAYQTVFGELHYTVIGHDMESGDLFPATKQFDEFVEAWKRKEEFDALITATAQAERNARSPW